MWLRQSTASQEIKLGAFLDSTDGNTQETGLTIANTDIKITKGGATTEVSKNSGGATHVAAGRYSAVLDATDTNTLGIMEVDVHVAGALAVHRSYMVLPATAYDALVTNGLFNFDPATDAVANVTLVATTTTNSDMVGTDNALLAASISLTGGAVDNVTTVATTTTVTNDVGITATAVDNIWDEVISKAAHNITNSAAVKLRNVASAIIRSDTAQGPGTGNNQIQLDTGASATDGAYDPAVVAIISGTGVGQTRLILQYLGSTKTATVDRDWKVNPDATSEFNIIADAGREHVNEGLAQAGTANTITLNTLASASDDVYIGQMVFIRSGTGEDQAGMVITYNGTTKVATIDRNWKTNPDTTSAYSMLPSSPVLLAATTHTGAVVPTVTTVTNQVTVSDILTTQMTEAYAADGTAPTLAQALFLIQQTIGDFSIAGTTITTKKLDGSTTAATYTLDDGTSPTSRTRAT